MNESNELKVRIHRRRRECAPHDHCLRAHSRDHWFKFLGGNKLNFHLAPFINFLNTEPAKRLSKWQTTSFSCKPVACGGMRQVRVVCYRPLQEPGRASAAAWRKMVGCPSTHPLTMQRSDAAIFITAVTTVAAPMTMTIAIGIEATAAFPSRPQLASEAPPSLHLRPALPMGQAIGDKHISGKYVKSPIWNM